MRIYKHGANEVDIRKKELWKPQSGQTDERG
jgi:hypothetical protein